MTNENNKITSILDTQPVSLENLRRIATSAAVSPDKLDAVQRAMDQANALQRAAAALSPDKLDVARRAMDHATTLQRAAAALSPDKLDAARRAMDHANVLQRAAAAMPFNTIDEATRRAMESANAFQLSTAALSSGTPEKTVRRAIDRVNLKQRPLTLALETKRSPSLIESPKDIGRVVRASRKIMGLTQQKFADLAGVGRRFVSELENGKATLELGKILRVCKAAGIDLTATAR